MGYPFRVIRINREALFALQMFRVSAIQPYLQVSLQFSDWRTCSFQFMILSPEMRFAPLYNEMRSPTSS